MRETKTTNFRIEDAITEAYEQMNEKRFDMIYRLDDMDNNYAGVVAAKAKKAGLFLRKRSVSMNRSAVELKGDVKKIDKFINSLPESHCGTDRKDEVNEQLSAKFSKDFDKEAKQKGPHQDSSVYKQMRDIIKSRGIGTVKTDKGSMKVDVQSAYRWLASYHMLTDKNKKNLIKMAQRGANSLATTIKVAQTLTVKR